MASASISIIISLVIGIMTLCAYLYVLRKQILQTLVPRDWLTNLRKALLGLLLLAIFGLVPTIAYQALRLYGGDSELLRNVASVSGNISRLTTAMFLIYVYEYRRKQ